MKIEIAAMEYKSDSLYNELAPLIFQNQRYEFIFEQLSTNPEVQKAFNETE